MNKLEELETRRDRIAGQVATLQVQLEELDGSEELRPVQRMVLAGLQMQANDFLTVMGLPLRRAQAK